MSNKRNRRRPGQRIRSETSRKPRRDATRAMVAFLAALPAERERKEQLRFWYRPTKAERMEREKRVRRWKTKPRKWRKAAQRRLSLKIAGHDLDN